jgi:hypothetical protein
MCNEVGLVSFAALEDTLLYMPNLFFANLLEPRCVTNC